MSVTITAIPLLSQLCARDLKDVFSSETLPQRDTEGESNI